MERDLQSAIDYKKHLVFSDLHGRSSLLEEIGDRYADSEVLFVSAGDLIGGPDTKGAIDVFLDLGQRALGVYGNHELVVKLAMDIADEKELGSFVSIAHAKYLKDIYRSYGMKNIPKSLSEKRAGGAFGELVYRLEEAGHKKYFDDLSLYYGMGSLLVIHAGVLPNKVWESDQKQMSQKVSLDEAQGKIKGGKSLEEVAGGEHVGDIPVQVFDTPNFILSRDRETPSHIRDKVLVTGHFHNPDTELDRITCRGRRVRLADMQNVRGPLYVYESWTGNVVPIRLK